MQFRSVSLSDLDANGEQAWRRLAGQSVDANPFYEPDFVIPADNEVMNRLWPDRRELVTAILARPGVRAGVIKRALRVAGAAATGSSSR